MAKRKRSQERQGFSRPLKILAGSREFRIFLTFFVIYSVFAGYLNWNENSRLDLTMSIVDQRSLRIDNYVNNTGDRALYEGHFYSDKAPGMSLLAVPVYAGYELLHGKPEAPQNLVGFDVTGGFYVFVLLAVILCSSLFGAMSVALVYRTLRYFTGNENHRLWITAAYGLGTLILIYSRLFFGHVTSAFFIFLSFYIIIRSQKEHEDHSLVAGLFCGLAVLIDYTALIAAFALLLLILSGNSWRKDWRIHWKKPAFYFIGVMIFTIILMGYQWQAFGSMFRTGYNHDLIDNETWSSFNNPEGSAVDSMPRDTALLYRAMEKNDESECRAIDAQKLRDRCYMHLAIHRGDAALCAESESNDDVMFCQGLITKDSSFCDDIGSIMYRQLCKEKIDGGFHVLQTVMGRYYYLRDNFRTFLGNLIKILAYPGKGILFLSPILIFSIIGLFLMFREDRRLSLFIMFIFAAYLLFNSTLQMWGGGNSFGVRHMIPVLPFLMLPLAYSFRRFGSKIYPYIIISILFMSVGLADYQQTKDLSFGSLRDNTALFANNIKVLAFRGPVSQLFQRIILNRVDFLPYSNVLLILMLIALVWGDQISRAFKLKRKWITAIALGSIVLILAGNSLLLVKSKNVYPLVDQLEQNGRGWYDKEVLDPFNRSMDSSWISADATIILYNLAGSQDVVIGLPVVNLYRNQARVLSVMVNNNTAKTLNISRRGVYYATLHLVPGKNVIMLKTDNCSTDITELGIPGRCLSLMLSRPRIR